MMSTAVATAAVGTAFTYQGQLKEGGAPANGDYDLMFTLFNQESEGDQVGEPVEVLEHTVTNGLFTVQLDFGPELFDGQALWLEVVVQPCGDEGETPVTLSPRQPVTAAPYAMYALSGPGGAGEFWAANDGDIYNTNSGEVGIGTTSPNYPLHVVSADTDAVYGESSVSGSAGVYGKASSFEGGGVGVRGDSYGSTGMGVFGIAAMSTGNNYGVYGQSQSQTGRGVYGYGASTSGVNYGVHGQTNSPDGWAGYFQGRGYFSGEVGVGMTDPSVETTLQVRADADNFGILVDSVGASGSEIGLHAGPAGYASLAKNAFFASGWKRFEETQGAFLQETTPDGDVSFNVAAPGSGFIDWTTPMTLTSEGKVGIGIATPYYALDVAGKAFMDTTFYSAGRIGTVGSNGELNAQFTTLLNYPNNGYVLVQDSTSTQQAAMYVDESGDGVILADTKYFRVPNPSQRGTEIWYACVEGPEAAAYIRGTAHLVDGRATVTFPDHFTAVATSKGMTVQTTPHSAESKGLAVVERSIGGFVVRELSNGAGTYDFDYTVMAVRKGHEDYRVIRPNTEGLPAGNVKGGKPGDADKIADREVP
jgi:hypothetical protein